jgi:phosphate acetyltransferase
MVPSELLSSIKKQAEKLKKTVVLPDAMDERTIKAARIIADEQVARPILIGSENDIRTKAQSLSVSLEGVRITDPIQSEQQSDFSHIFFNLRKKKGLDFTEAQKIMKHPLYFGAMMVRVGNADDNVAESLSTTDDVLRAAIQVIGLRKGISVVSSFFLMVFPHRVFSFADNAIVPDPTIDQLADIAITTAENHMKLTGEEPRVAMLSFSTKGSASHPLIDKVKQATALVRSKAPQLVVDGELQLDAAIVPNVARSKAPGSPVEGNGNIGYKMAERLGGAQAIGPIVQGLKKPAFDLSRGCSVNDIVNTVAINCILAA